MLNVCYQTDQKTGSKTPDSQEVRCVVGSGRDGQEVRCGWRRTNLADLASFSIVDVRRTIRVHENEKSVEKAQEQGNKQQTDKEQSKEASVMMQRRSTPRP